MGAPFDLFKCVESWKKEKWLREKESEEDRPQSVGLLPWAGNKYLSSREEDGQTCAHSNEGRSTLFFRLRSVPSLFYFWSGPDPVITTVPENETKCIFLKIGRRTFFSRVARQTVCLHHNKRYAGEKATEFKFHQWLEQKNAGGGVIITPPTHCVSVDNIARATNSLTVFLFTTTGVTTLEMKKKKDSGPTHGRCF